MKWQRKQKDRGGRKYKTDSWSKVEEADFGMTRKKGMNFYLCIQLTKTYAKGMKRGKRRGQGRCKGEERSAESNRPRTCRVMWKKGAEARAASNSTSQMTARFGVHVKQDRRNAAVTLELRDSN